MAHDAPDVAVAGLRGIDREPQLRRRAALRCLERGQPDGSAEDRVHLIRYDFNDAVLCLGAAYWIALALG